MGEKGGGQEEEEGEGENNAVHALHILIVNWFTNLPVSLTQSVRAQKRREITAGAVGESHALALTCRLLDRKPVTLYCTLPPSLSAVLTSSALLSSNLRLPASGCGCTSLPNTACRFCRL